MLQTRIFPSSTTLTNIIICYWQVIFKIVSIDIPIILLFVYYLINFSCTKENSGYAFGKKENLGGHDPPHLHRAGRSRRNLAGKFKILCNIIWTVRENLMKFGCCVILAIQNFTKQKNLQHSQILKAYFRKLPIELKEFLRFFVGSQFFDLPSIDQKILNFMQYIFWNIRENLMKFRCYILLTIQNSTRQKNIQIFSYKKFNYLITDSN